MKAEPQNSIERQVGTELSIEVGIALLVAAGQLFALRGADPRTFLLLMPAALAVFAVHRHPRRASRRTALAFLVLLGIGVLIAHFPAIFPNMPRVDKRLPAAADRLLAWNNVIYVVFALGVIPVRMFVDNLLRHRRGERASISPPTCYLGLATTALLWCGMPYLVGMMLGFWKLPEH
jgi:hypothetical protein